MSFKNKFPVNQVETFCGENRRKPEFWPILALFVVKKGPKNMVHGDLFSKHF